MLKFTPFLILLVFCTSLVQSQNKKEINVTTTKVTEHIYMLTGQGGNVAVSVGNDGIFMVDDQYAHMSPKLLSAITTLSKKPIKFLLNTHWHGDHTGGNENFQKEGAVIVAHENVRKRMSVDQFNKERNKTTKAAPKSALPVVTFSKDLTFHMNGEAILVTHVHNAHTDGDALVYFVDSNVLHMGDTYFQGKYPFIDLASGGSIKGYIAAQKKALLICNDDTMIIPGHRNLSNKKELKAYVTMLETITQAIQTKIDLGFSLEAVTNDSSITAAYDALGYGDWFIDSATFRKTIYKSLTKPKADNE